MNRIIIRGDVSDLFQHIYVYKDGEKIDSIGVLFEDVTETILIYLEKYDLHHIDLAGAKVYTQKLEQEIKDALILKYNTTDITFRYV